MKKNARVMQLTLQFLSFLGAVALAVGVYLWFGSGKAFFLKGFLLMLFGTIFILGIFIFEPFIDPHGKRGQKKQIRNIKRFNSNANANLIINVFQKYIQHYPEAMKKYPERIPASIEFAKKENDIYNIIYRGTEYIFRFKKTVPKKDSNQNSISDEPKRARLELFKNGRRRLDMTVIEAQGNHYLPYWVPETILYLNLGAGIWIKDMKKLIKDAKKTARYYIWNS